jgi:hypothetical protein
MEPRGLREGRRARAEGLLQSVEPLFPLCVSMKKVKVSREAEMGRWEEGRMRWRGCSHSYRGRAAFHQGPQR